MQDNLSDLTIVIPTLNREHELKKSIKYWESVGVQVLILDGSDKPIYSNGPLSVGSRISYYSFPREISESYLFGSYFRRMHFAASQVNTKYVSLCADDDFFLESGLVKAIQLLDSDTAIDSVFRPCIDYRLIDGCVNWNIEYLSWEDNMAGASEDVRTRVIKTDRGYINFYSITRTEEWKTLLKICFEFEFDHSHVLQLLMDEVGKILLRTATLEDLLYVRQYNHPLKYSDGNIGVASWLKNIENSKKVELIRDQLRLALSLADDMSSHEELVDVIIRFYSSSVRDFANTTTAMLVAKFWWVPELVRNRLNQLIPRRLSFFLGYRGKVIRDQGLPLILFKEFLTKNRIPFVEQELDQLSQLLT